MGQTPFLKQVVDFNKASFDNSFDTMEMVQGQSEIIVDTLWAQTDQASTDAKQAVSEWRQMCRKSSDELKKAVDDGYRKLSMLFGAAEEKKTAEPEQKEKTKSEKREKPKTK